MGNIWYLSPSNQGTNRGVGNYGTEKEQMNVLLPEVMQFVEEHKYPVTLDNPAYEPGRPFRYNLLPNNWCYIHIRNAKMPESFLADAGYVAENLRYVMDKAEKENNCDTILL